MGLMSRRASSGLGGDAGTGSWTGAASQEWQTPEGLRLYSPFWRVL